MQTYSMQRELKMNILAIKIFSKDQRESFIKNDVNRNGNHKQQNSREFSPGVKY